MSFSLSDPDFALILNNIDRSPQRSTERIPRSADSRGTIKADADGYGSPGSSPSSPLGASSSALARSPQMDTLSSSVDDSSSRSPSRTRLGPNDQSSTPQLLRTRQPSAESTTSVTSKLDPDSAFATLVELVAAAKHNGHDRMSLELGMLSGVISEMEDSKDTIAGLKSKYTGAKVIVLINLIVPC